MMRCYWNRVEKAIAADGIDLANPGSGAQRELRPVEPVMQPVRRSVPFFTGK